MKPIGNWLFASGVAVAIASVALGNSLQDELATLPLAQLMREGGPDALRMLGFAFGVPLGIGLCLLGAVAGSGAGARRVGLFAVVVLVGVLAAGLVPKLAGRELHAAFFGTGGLLILALVLILIRVWGHYRASLPPPARTGADLQGIGYLCFALAAWNLCGLAAMPSFGLTPETMLVMGSRPFAIGQAKAIMVLFLLGWLSSLAGIRLATRRPDQGEA